MSLTKPQLKFNRITQHTSRRNLFYVLICGADNLRRTVSSTENTNIDSRNKSMNHRKQSLIEDDCLLWQCVYNGHLTEHKCLPTFQRNLLPPSLGVQRMKILGNASQRTEKKIKCTGNSIKVCRNTNIIFKTLPT